jgi:carbonic anhydrase
MNVRSFSALTLGLFFCGLALSVSASDTETSIKPKPEAALAMLKQGNERFASGKAYHPHVDADRLKKAASENQSKHAFATVLGCSDSRVPAEILFDAGIMDLFVIRVAGNVCNTDEIGSIEYGLLHVNTPVLVPLGHTQCGAVTAVTEHVQGKGHKLERNIPPLVAPIFPAVKEVIAANPKASGEDLLNKSIEQNVWVQIENLFMKSPAVRSVVKQGKVKVAPGIYDLHSGKIKWLSEAKVGDILSKVEVSPDKAVNPMAE